MEPIALKTMMIHVERIVRPVRAAELRKLQMRRELLAHLQAALEEERPAAPGEPAAWEAATRRLGTPAELTRELQKAVPLIERLTIWNAPKGRWKTPWETRFTTGMFGMKLWQALLFLAAFNTLVFGWWPFVAPRWKEPPPPLWESYLFHVVLWALSTSILCVALIFLSFRILDVGAQNFNGRRFLLHGIAATGLVLAMHANFGLLSAVRWTDLLGILHWTDFLWLPWVGLAITAGLAWLGRFLRPGIRDFGEWFALDLAK
jgi:hypothetical protein